MACHCRRELIIRIWYQIVVKLILAHCGDAGGLFLIGAALLWRPRPLAQLSEPRTLGAASPSADPALQLGMTHRLERRLATILRLKRCQLMPLCRGQYSLRPKPMHKAVEADS